MGNFVRTSVQLQSHQNKLLPWSGQWPLRRAAHRMCRHSLSGILRVLNCVLESKSSVNSCESTLLFMAELTGVEPVSEKKSVRVSPGAVCLLDFPWCGRAHTHYTLVAS